MFLRNVAGTIELFAFDATTGLPKDGDGANLTAYVNIDNGGINALADTSASELSSTNAKGWYVFSYTQGESNGEKLHFTGKSSTANIVVVGRVVLTMPTTGVLSPATLGRTLVVDAAGLADANAVKLGPSGSGAAQTARDIGASVLLSSGTGTGQVSLSSGQVLVQSGTGSGQLSVTSGVVKSQLADGLVHGGTTAKISLGSATNDVAPLTLAMSASNGNAINITNTNDDAVRIQSGNKGLYIVTTGQEPISLSGGESNFGASTHGAITATDAGNDIRLGSTSVGLIQSGLATAAALTTLAGKFTGITLLAQWLGALMGKQTPNSTALTEINATGAGSGTYSATTDSLEARRDGDFNATEKASINTEADTALTDYDGPTNAELATALAAADDAILAQVALVKAATDNLPSDPADASVIAGRFDTVDASLAALPTANQIATAVDTATSTYTAEVKLVRDDANSRDVYSVTFKKNGILATVSGTPTINVKNETNGNLIATSNLTSVGSSTYKYIATSGERGTSGVVYTAIVTATVDASSRGWTVPVGKDSAA